MSSLWTFTSRRSQVYQFLGCYWLSSVAHFKYHELVSFVPVRLTCRVNKWISCHRPCLCQPSVHPPPLPPPPNYLSTVFDVSCNHCITQEKLQRMAIHFFLGGGGGRGRRQDWHFQNAFTCLEQAVNVLFPPCSHRIFNSHDSFDWLTNSPRYRTNHIAQITSTHIVRRNEINLLLRDYVITF